LLLVLLPAAASLAFGGVEGWAWGMVTLGGLLVLLVWLVPALARGQLSIAPNPLYVPMLLFGLLAAVQWVSRRSVDPGATEMGLVRLLGYAIFFFLAANLLETPRQLRRYAQAATIFGFFLALFAIVQMLTFNGKIYWTVEPRFGGWIVGPYVNHNHYAGLMEMLVALSVGLLLDRSVARERKPLIAFCGVLMAVSLILTGSRGGLVAFLFQVIFFFYLILRGVRLASAAPIRRAWFAVPVLAVILIGFLWLDPGSISARYAQFMNQSLAGEVALEQRVPATLDTLRIFRDHLPLGVGLGAFPAVFPQYCRFAMFRLWTYAHNDIAQVMAEMGLPGTLFMIWFFWALFRNGPPRRARSADWLRQAGAGLKLGALLGCAGIFVHSFVDFNLHIPANGFWFFSLAGLSTARILARTEEAIES
jgi:O-antigen ligase